MSDLIKKSVQAMSGYVPGEQPRNRKVIKLNTNENPYPPSQKVRDVLDSFSIEDLALYPDPVCRDLRELLGEIHGCHPDQVFVGNGSDEILAVAIRAFVERSGSVGYFDPSYSLYPVLAQIEEVATRAVELGPDFGWTMPDDYEASLFFLTNPNAPTSMLFPKAEVEAFCKRFSGVVLIDEAYVDFASEDCMDLALEYPNVLSARTLSKSCSLAGLRLGYAVGPQDLIEAMFKVKDSYNVSMLSQRIALAALSDLPHREMNIERVRITRGQMTEALQERGFEVFPSDTNFLWAKPSRMAAADLFEALRDDGIFVRYFPGRLTGDYLRISVGTEGDLYALTNALDRIAGD